MLADKSNLNKLINFISNSFPLIDKKESFMWLGLIGLDQKLAVNFELLSEPDIEDSPLKVLENINRVSVDILYQLIGICMLMKLDFERVFLGSYDDATEDTIYSCSLHLLSYDQNTPKIKNKAVFFEKILSNYFITLTIAVSNVGVNFDWLIEKEIKQRNKKQIKPL